MIASCLAGRMATRRQRTAPWRMQTAGSVRQRRKRDRPPSRQPGMDSHPPCTGEQEFYREGRKVRDVVASAVRRTGRLARAWPWWLLPSGWLLAECVAVSAVTQPAVHSDCRSWARSRAPADPRTTTRSWQPPATSRSEIPRRTRATPVRDSSPASLLAGENHSEGGAGW